MRVLIIGNGGREHALGWGICHSASQRKDIELFFAPGNPGTSTLGTNIAIPVTNIEELEEFARENEIDLTVVGPEVPLS
ncbi:MAG: phosphoribosylamine--glycine ligase, partial [Bdellovibrionales bacterium]|nr:phosphoribosylamine--glycine ligase [Bdellovibrionales bacterium]